MPLTPLENFRMMFSGKMPEWIPFTLDVGGVPGFTESIMRLFKARTGADNPAEYFNYDFRTAALATRFGGGDPAEYQRDVPQGTTFDAWGIGHWAGGAEDTYEQTFSPLVDVVEPREIRDYPEPIIDSTGLAEAVESFHERGYPVAAYGGSIYEWSWWLRGMENFMIDLVTAPETAEALVEKVSSFTIKLALESARCGIDILAFYDDAGMQTGMQIAPELWRRTIKPAWKRAISTVKQEHPDVICFLHSCGNIEAIVPDIVEVGFDVLHPIQPECMDTGMVKQEFGNRIVPCATLGSQRIASFGSADDVRRETMRLMDKIGGDKRCIICPSNFIQPETPWENILAFAETARNYRGGRDWNG